MSTDTGTAFTQALWEEITPIFEAIVDHPFLAGIADGSLPPERFVYFVEQDRLYLRAYSRALSYTAGHAEDPGDTAVFTGSASNAIAVEAGMHRELLSGLGADPEASREELSPSGELYVQTILSQTARGPFADALASVLACFWIYAEVGKEMKQKGSPEPSYQRWLDTYGDPRFAETVAQVLAIVERVGAESSESQRERFAAIFARGCRLEWMFWDCAWREETWPI
ncbi:MAG: thiaminase II [Actinobacteria bacterium]|nr:thiaminase II [Actinomycetota bacterium]